LVRWIGIPVAILAVAIALIANSVHIIHEGSVGIYFRNGALMNVSTKPGMHWKIPIITRLKSFYLKDIC